MLHGTCTDAQSVSTVFSLCNQEQLHKAVDREEWFGRLPDGSQVPARKSLAVGLSPSSPRHCFVVPPRNGSGLFGTIPNAECGFDPAQRCGIVTVVYTRAMTGLARLALPVTSCRDIGFLLDQLTQRLMAQEHVQGCFVTIDGPNGVGKSTILAHLERRLRDRGVEPVLTAEPSHSALGRFIRENQEQYRGGVLACLVAADRYAHIEHEIKPALDNGRLVISDRYVLSSLVYQILDGVSTAFVLALNRDILVPHLTILLTASPATTAKRLNSRPDLTRFEREHHMTEGLLYEKALTTMEGMGYNCRRVENDQVSPEECSEHLESLVLRTMKASR